MKKEDITLLELDHPGANDQAYRKRRAIIAQKADAYFQDPSTIPHIRYTKKEHQTWATVLRKLHGLHAQYASQIFLSGKECLEMSETRIPQLGSLSRKLTRLSDFKLEPIAGLVDSRFFLKKLQKRTMLCTQYVRHHSRPEYTPEPDVIHEIIGHVPMFLNKDFSDFSQRIGRAAHNASEKQLIRINNLYWFTIEFGLIKENGEVKALGAGLLSSFGELEHAFSGAPTWRDFSISEILNTPHVYSQMQKTLFVIPSFEVLHEETERFLKEEGL